jgi:hypothetical protein
MNIENRDILKFEEYRYILTPNNREFQRLMLKFFPEDIEKNEDIENNQRKYFIELIKCNLKIIILYINVFTIIKLNIYYILDNDINIIQYKFEERNNENKKEEFFVNLFQREIKLSKELKCIVVKKVKF